ncbi:MAG: DMT family transporter [Pseudomonadota bacterium]
MTNLYLVAAVLIGAAFACQPGINAAAAKVLGSPFPATVLSVGITLLASAVVMVATKTTPPLSSVAALPWWVVIGGLIGVVVIGAGVVMVPITGIALFFVCMIAGQLLGSVFLDHVGAFGLAVREVSPVRLGGVALAFVGVLLVSFG